MIYNNLTRYLLLELVMEIESYSCFYTLITQSIYHDE